MCCFLSLAFRSSTLILRFVRRSARAGYAATCSLESAIITTLSKRIKPKLEVCEKSIQVSGRIVQKRLGDNNVIEAFVLDLFDFTAIEVENGSTGKSHDDRRVRGNDKLRILSNHHFHHREQDQLPHWGKRRFRLVQQV